MWIYTSTPPYALMAWTTLPYFLLFFLVILFLLVLIFLPLFNLLFLNWFLLYLLFFSSLSLVLSLLFFVSLCFSFLLFLHLSRPTLLPFSSHLSTPWFLIFHLFQYSDPQKCAFTFWKGCRWTQKLPTNVLRAGLALEVPHTCTALYRKRPTGLASLYNVITLLFPRFLIYLYSRL
jgi:hypothetical protein